ncbi:hypothetical protein GA0061081_102205 [Gilliamella bombicola]|uniref:Uncharacterized protein n=1 Tax=Gilliamella bombicola TaxID=1798182 RepID=A0A1C4A2F2_9GAMM|nr:hypothetical protein [Gilliamella bombicola]SCB88620.1 hypothetical protein GA0061081_102205 [Gilliamella bombicola]
MKLRVTKRGCFGRIDGAVAELPIGYEFCATDIPTAFIGRVIVLEQQSVEVEADKKKKGK